MYLWDGEIGVQGNDYKKGVSGGRQNLQLRGQYVKGDVRYTSHYGKAYDYTNDHKSQRIACGSRPTLFGIGIRRGGPSREG